MSGVKLVTVSCPKNIEGVNTAEDFIAYAARVSNPANQINTETAPKLLKYLIKNKHWSPFEMVHVCLEIKTTRDIGRQILRHRSFSFQEFSQRYAEVASDFVYREARMQDTKNRQNSLTLDMDSKVHGTWNILQKEVQDLAKRSYAHALDAGIAKEQARALLPEGMTMSTMYMAGSLRSWIHYCELRMEKGTQKEHREIAVAAWNVITKEFPSLKALFEPEVIPTPESLGLRTYKFNPSDLTTSPHRQMASITTSQIRALTTDQVAALGSINVSTATPNISKEQIFAWMSEWAKENLPPVPPNWKDIKLPDTKAPENWDRQGGTPMVKSFDAANVKIAPRWEHE